MKGFCFLSILILGFASNVFGQIEFSGKVQNQMRGQWLVAESLHDIFLGQKEVKTDWDYNKISYSAHRDTIQFQFDYEWSVSEIISGSGKSRFDTTQAHTKYAIFRIERLNQDSLTLAAQNEFALEMRSRALGTMFDIRRVSIQNRRLKLFRIETLFERIQYDSIILLCKVQGPVREHWHNLTIYSDGSYKYAWDSKLYNQDKVENYLRSGFLKKKEIQVAQNRLNESGLRLLQNTKKRSNSWLSHEPNYNLKVYSQNDVLVINEKYTSVPLPILKFIEYLKEISFYED